MHCMLAYGSTVDIFWCAFVVAHSKLPIEEHLRYLLRNEWVRLSQCRPGSVPAKWTAANPRRGVPPFLM